MHHYENQCWTVTFDECFDCANYHKNWKLLVHRWQYRETPSIQHTKLICLKWCYSTEWFRFFSVMFLLFARLLVCVFLFSLVSSLCVCVHKLLFAPGDDSTALIHIQCSIQLECALSKRKHTYNHSLLFFFSLVCIAGKLAIFSVNHHTINSHSYTQCIVYEMWFKWRNEKR